jgi:hypothetical protein
MQAKVVLEVFTHDAPVLELRVAGRIIRTTSEHPFWVVGKGWVVAGELAEGDLLRTPEGDHVPVQQVVQTLVQERVYNLRIADFHTYFVGCDEWGFSVWAHNTCVYHYGLPNKTVLAAGETWVTDKRHFYFDEAIAITNLQNPSAISEYTIDLDQNPPGIVNWLPGLVSGGHQGQLAVSLSVPPVVEANVPRRP